MASGSNYLTTYYAKRIVGDTAAADASKALLQTGANITTHSWILIRSNRLTDKYGIRYKYDSSNANDRIEFYGGYQVSNADAPTAWVQLDTGDAYFLGKVGIGYDPNTSGNTYKLYVNGTGYFSSDLTTASGLFAATIELSSATPYIDFHFDSSSADYTSRIIESASGYLQIPGSLGIGGSKTDYKFYVKGTSYFTNIAYFGNGTTYYISADGSEYSGNAATATTASYLEAPNEYGYYTDEYGNFIYKYAPDPDDTTTAGYFHLDNNDKTISLRYYWDSGDLRVPGKVGIGYNPTTSGNTHKLYVKGTSYFNGNTTHNGIDYFANGTTYYINNSAVAYFYDLRSYNVRLVENWIGFYQNANAGGSRYGYIQANANRMYFRKENGVSTYAFDFNGHIYSSGSLFLTSTNALYGTLGEFSSTTESDVGGLTWQNHDSGPSTSVNANDGPTSAWWYILRNRHTNTNNNYYTDLAIPFNKNTIYYKRICGGAIQNTSSVSNGWIAVLDQLNYTDWTVTKTGSGASGTWGISVTGNAATATTASSCSGNSATATRLQAPDSRSTNESPSTLMEWGRGITTAFKQRSTVGTPNGSGTYGIIINLTPWGDSSGSRPKQLWIDDSSMSIRHSTSDSAWSDWSRFVTNSGTWGISITGDANTVDGYHASSLWRSDGGTWNNGANISCTGGGEWSFDLSGNGYWHVWSGQNGKSILQCDNYSCNVTIPSGGIICNHGVNFMVGGNEFNFIPDNFNNSVWFNYTCYNRNNTATVSSYVFGNGRTGAMAYIGLNYFQAASGDLLLYSSNGHRLSMQTDRNLVIYTSGGGSVWQSGTSTSTYRVKESITPIDKNEINNLFKLNVIRFNYKKEMNYYDTSRRYGMIAEEVLPLFPDIVDIPEEYDPEKFDLSKGIRQPLPGIRYERFIPLLIRCVQLQQERIDKLEKLVEERENL